MVGGASPTPLTVPVPETKPLVIATDRDAVRAKIVKWILRGEKIESTFVALPSMDEIKGQSLDWMRTQLLLVDQVAGAERLAIHNWHWGVVHELRAIGKGAPGLYRLAVL